MAIDNAGEVGGTGPVSLTGQIGAAVYSGGTAYGLDTPPDIQQDPETLDKFPSYLTGLSPNGAYGVGNWNFYVVPNPPGTSYACVRTPKTVGSTTSRTNGGTWMDISANLCGHPRLRGRLHAIRSVGGQQLGSVRCWSRSAVVTDKWVARGAMTAVIYQMGTGAVTQLGGGFEVGPVLGEETFNQDSQLQQSINASGQVVGSEVVGRGKRRRGSAQRDRHGPEHPVCRLSCPAVLSSTTPQPSTITATSPATDTTPAETRFRRLSCRPCCPAMPTGTAR